MIIEQPLEQLKGFFGSPQKIFKPGGDELRRGILRVFLRHLPGCGQSILTPTGRDLRFGPFLPEAQYVRTELGGSLERICCKFRLTHGDEGRAEIGPAFMIAGVGVDDLPEKLGGRSVISATRLDHCLQAKGLQSAQSKITELLLRIVQSAESDENAHQFDPSDGIGRRQRCGLAYMNQRFFQLHPAQMKRADEQAEPIVVRMFGNRFSSRIQRSRKVALARAVKGLLGNRRNGHHDRRTRSSLEQECRRFPRCQSISASDQRTRKR